MYRFIVDRFSEITNSINCTMSEQSVICYLAFNLYIHVPWYLTFTCTVHVHVHFIILLCTWNSLHVIIYMYMYILKYPS